MEETFFFCKHSGSVLQFSPTYFLFFFPFFSFTDAFDAGPITWWNSSKGSRLACSEPVASIPISASAQQGRDNRPGTPGQGRHGKRPFFLIKVSVITLPLYAFAWVLQLFFCWFCFAGIVSSQDLGFCVSFLEGRWFAFIPLQSICLAAVATSLVNLANPFLPSPRLNTTKTAHFYILVLSLAPLPPGLTSLMFKIYLYLRFSTGKSDLCSHHKILQTYRVHYSYGPSLHTGHRLMMQYHT